MTTVDVPLDPGAGATLPAPPPAPTSRLSATPCQCESNECAHAYVAVPAECGTICDYVGAVCGDCAETHLRPYMISIRYEGTGYRP